MADASAAHEVDSEFYQPASRFFPSHGSTALTYDDVTLATLYTEILPKESQIDTRLAEGFTSTSRWCPPTWTPSPRHAWP